MSPAHRSARELADEALRLLLAKDMAGFAGLWASDGVLEFPFAEPGNPQRLDGRDAIHEYLRDYPEHIDIREITERAVHGTTDPAVVIVEFAVEGVVPRTGNPYDMRYVAVITARDGQIARYRDYWSPAAATRALGQLPSSFASGAR